MKEASRRGIKALILLDVEVKLVHMYALLLGKCEVREASESGVLAEAARIILLIAAGSMNVAEGWR